VRIGSASPAAASRAGRSVATPEPIAATRQCRHSIEATVGDLSDGETLLSLHLAIKANRYLRIS
jgi:hypothetical protein